jgi:L-threonylcarbamoyladenylate synthase
VVAIPTESSYGLAVDPTDLRAVTAVLRIKGRPEGQALPVVAGSEADLGRLGLSLDLPALEPVRAAWPAPLTVVVPCRGDLPAACGLESLAVRVPAHRRLRELLRGLGRSVTATSANRSGEPPATTPEEVLDLLRGEAAIVIDDGALPGGEPSTIVTIRGGELVVLRQGRYPEGRLVGD